MARKQYSLDYSIERDTDRLKAVQTILDNLETKPTNTDLELMASYILYGKDEEGQNAVKRGEITDDNKRYNSFQKLSEKNQSLDNILDNPLADQQSLKMVGERYIYTKKKPSITRPKYNKKTGELIDPGDSDIPGMQQLWDTIDRLEHIVAVNEGKVPPDEETQIFTDSYRLYQLKHSLIDIRRHQYYLKDAYKPALRFLNASSSTSQLYNWDSDAAYWMPLDKWQERVDNALVHTISRSIQDYETRVNPNSGETEARWIVRHHTFDWENPFHIKCLIDNYSNLYMQVWDKPDSWSRTLIYDFDRYFDMCDFSPVRTYILTRRIDKASFSTIVNELEENFNIKYNENHLASILSKEIPEKIALVAKKYRMMIEYPNWKKKTCYTCGKQLPRDSLFFARNKGRKDKFSSNCKECERKRRIEKGGQNKYDGRSKDKTMPEMPTGKTRA